MILTGKLNVDIDDVLVKGTPVFISFGERASDLYIRLVSLEMCEYHKDIHNEMAITPNLIELPSKANLLDVVEEFYRQWEEEQQEQEEIPFSVLENK